MPVTLDDDLTVLLIKHLVSAKSPPGTGAAILAAVQEGQKLLRDLTAKVDTMSTTTSTTDAAFRTELAGIQADMQAQTSVTNSVLVFVSGMSTKLAEAIAAAQQGGATEDELVALKSLHTDLKANTAALISATTANTPSAAEPVTPVEPTTTVPVADPAPAGDTGTTTGDDTGTATIGE